jgi:hypothetical protein
MLFFRTSGTLFAHPAAGASGPRSRGPPGPFARPTHSTKLCDVFFGGVCLVSFGGGSHLARSGLANPIWRGAIRRPKVAMHMPPTRRTYFYGVGVAGILATHVHVHMHVHQCVFVNMCMHICIWMCASAYVCVCMCIRMCLCLCMWCVCIHAHLYAHCYARICLSACVCSCRNVCKQVCMGAGVCTCVCGVCVYVFVRVHTHACTHTHTHTHTGMHSVNTCARIRPHACAHAHTRTHMHMLMRSHTRRCTNTHAHIRVHELLGVYRTSPDQALRARSGEVRYDAQKSPCTCRPQEKYMFVEWVGRASWPRMCMCICMCISMCLCTCACTFACGCVHLHVFVCACASHRIRILQGKPSSGNTTSRVLGDETLCLLIPCTHGNEARNTRPKCHQPKTRLHEFGCNALTAGLR